MESRTRLENSRLQLYYFVLVLSLSFIVWNMNHYQQDNKHNISKSWSCHLIISLAFAKKILPFIVKLPIIGYAGAGGEVGVIPAVVHLEVHFRRLVTRNHWDCNIVIPWSKPRLVSHSSSACKVVTPLIGFLWWLN